MKINISIYLMIFIAVISLSCSDDNADNNEQLNSERDATLLNLTGGENRVWRITQAQLENASGEFDISNNFNIVDDEFIFSGTASSGELEWRQFNDINLMGANPQETLRDFYRSPTNSAFNFNTDSSTSLTGLNGRFSFNVINNNLIEGMLNFPDQNALLRITLNQKTANDYASPPENGLNFSPAFTFETTSINCCAPGMIGSYSDNSFFIALRENNSTPELDPERIIKFDLNNNSVSEIFFDQQDRVSKQLHIVDNELIVFGAEYVNTYPLDISSQPESVPHGKVLSRFGMAVQDNLAYIIGGDLNVDDNPVSEADKIFAWDLTSQSLSEVTTLPAMRSGARGAIVNNKLYVFGGTTEFLSGDPSDTIFAYDLINDSLETFNLNQNIDLTYVNSFENLIYVAGQIRNVVDDQGNPMGNDFTIGVFDTQTNTYQELETNLIPNNNLTTIHEMCIFNGNMYVLFGDGGDQLQEWTIFSASLN